MSSNNVSPSEDVSISVSAGVDIHLQVVAVDEWTADLLAGTEETDGTVLQILALGLMAQPDQ